MEDLPTDTIQGDLASAESDLRGRRKLYEKYYAKYRAAIADDDDMMAERLEVDCRGVAEEIKLYEGVVSQLRAKIAAKARTEEITRQFTDYCRKVNNAFEAVNIPFEKKKEMLTALRVTVLAHSDGPLKLQTNLGSILEICPEIKSLVSHQIGNNSDQFKTDLTLEFSL